ncbi:MAG: tRNA epoxyqueuosine(34) reductase QueG [Bacteroidia bacterium]|nr:tRNA epoxyqueuosine(34) reductase QueG [Bacteroidia bacterium]
MPDLKARHTAVVKKTALELGFQCCGISKAEYLEEEAPRLADWLKKGYQGSMGYLENHFDKRLDPTKLVPGAKSVISFLYNYNTSQQLDPHSFKVAKYAFGDDYHKVIKDKLFEFLDILRTEIGDIKGRVFVDSGPVMERAWAEKSGLGWIGKHGLLITKEQGSFMFIAELILDIDLDADQPFAKDYCGTCNACVEACPTAAILPNKTLYASRCISYLTIELKEAIPDEFKNNMNGWIYGCDICQDVCPWNRFGKPNNEPKFQVNEKLPSFTKEDWREITEDIFQDLFKDSPITRAGFKGLKRNIDFVTESES